MAGYNFKDSDDSKVDWSGTFLSDRYELWKTFIKSYCNGKTTDALFLSGIVFQIDALIMGDQTANPWWSGPSVHGPSAH